MHVVIAGGGVGALEGLLALQALAADSAQVSVVTPGRYLTYRALSVAEPFGGAPAPRFEWAAIARDRGVRWVQDALTGVRPGERRIETRDGPPLAYDALLLALGARPLPALPGALTFAGPRDVLAVREALAEIEPGRPYRIAFAALTGTAWTLPLYELALLAGEHGRRAGLELALEVVTAEPAPLAAFGGAASTAIALRLAAAGIGVRTRTHAAAFAAGRLELEPEGSLQADLVVALPHLRGPRVPGIPHDGGGFVSVDPYCRVRGLDRVWAVGDMTTRPLKQGGLAAQQADVAAAGIAALAGGRSDVKPYRPRLRGLLFTGREPAFLERRPHAPPASEASEDFLWWPPQKVAGRYFGPYLESLGATRVSGGG
jgi:sulfide:quinone oxidoreductase